MAKRQRHVYLVDGSGYIFRAFHALPPLTRADGTPINAVLGFTNMLLKLLEETDADHIGVIFDAEPRQLPQRDLRRLQGQPPEPPPELIPQFPLVREAARAFNVPVRRDGGLRGRRPHRDLCLRGGGRGRRRSPSSPPTRT